MKKLLYWLLSLAAIGVICGLSFFVGMQMYFNRFYFYTPDFIGMSYSDAQKHIPFGTIHIQEEGKNYSDYPKGVIFKQEPLPDKVVKKGRDIKVWVSLGKDEYKVPDFIGYNLIQVKSELEKEGVEVGDVAFIKSNLPYNTIVATNPRVGAHMPKSEKISFLVSNFENRAETIMPDVEGMSLSEAKRVLEDKNLILGTVHYERIVGLDPGIVIEASIAPKKKVTAGTTVDLVVSN